MVAKRIGYFATALRDDRGRVLKADGSVAGKPIADSKSDGDADAAHTDTDPASALASGDGSDPVKRSHGRTGRKRGRPFGSRTRPRTPDGAEGKKAPVSVGGLQQTLTEIHGFLAALLGAPEIELQDEEARQLAGAIKEVERHYKLPALAADKIALATLVWVAGRIYVPKAMTFAARTRAVKGAADRPVAAPSSPHGQAAPASVTDWFDPEALPAALN